VLSQNKLKPYIFLCINQQGIALILVLWVIALLTMIALEFSYAMRTQLTLTRNLLDDTQAYYLAQAGINQTILELLRYNKLRPKGHRSAQKGSSTTEEETELPDWSWIRAGEPYEISWENGKAKVLVSDEGGKININIASRPQLVKLVANAGVSGDERDIIVDSILDWRDVNNFHRLNGAEEDYYQQLDPPYSCKDGHFDTIEELLFVRGVTPEIFYGSSYMEENKKGEQSSTSEEETYQGLAPFITVYRSSPRPSTININTAPALVLETIPGITPELAQLIIQERKQEAFTRIDDVYQRLGKWIGGGNFSFMQNRINTYIPTVCTIESTGQVNNSQVQRTIKTIVKIDPYGKTPVNFLYWKDSVWSR
jgi:general secretion pathway protein K